MTPVKSASTGTHVSVYVSPDALPSGISVHTLAIGR